MSDLEVLELAEAPGLKAVWQSAVLEISRRWSRRNLSALSTRPFPGHTQESRARKRQAILALLLLGSMGTALLATTITPISDEELFRRADVVVRGTVLTSQVEEDRFGRPETVSVIRPLAIWKGSLRGDLVLRQAGGVLPDGRFFKLWGRPEYVPGREVIVFAIALPAGDYQTAEMLLGKFEVWKDEAGRHFAVPDLAVGVHPGVDVIAEPPVPSVPRELTEFRSSLRRPTARSAAPPARPVGFLTPIVHVEATIPRAKPEWGNINNSLYRYNNNATAVWTLQGTANITGGGAAEAQGAVNTWTNDPNSTINYTLGTGSSNLIQLNASSSPCGWSTCLSGSGVIGCGGPSGGGSNAWRGDTYITITGGTVWLRAVCSFNGFDSITTQSVLTHELGHTLGLGHSDQNFSPHDVCSGDESLATMRSTAQYRTSLGTDDRDAIRWIYGDGGNSCALPPPPSVTVISPSSGPTAGGTPVTLTGSNFQVGATVTIGGIAATGVNVASSTSITATTGPHAAGAVSATVTNPDAQTGTGGTFTHVCGPAPTASVTGGGLVCAGSAAQIQATLTGSPPWGLTWSDGFVQTGVTSSPATRAVSPSSTTLYTVTSLTGALCAGTSSGSAAVTVVSCAGGPPSGNLVPDGRSVRANVSPSGNSYSLPARASASYAGEIDVPFNGAGTVAGGGPFPLLSITRADGATALATAPLDRATCGASATARLSFAPSTADLAGGPLQFHVSDGTSFGYPVRLRVSETTLYSPRWSTSGYAAFIDVQNTSGCPVSGQVFLLDSSGANVTTFFFSLGPGAATQLSIPTGLAASAGSARLIHDGPTGAVTAGIYMTSSGPAGAAFRWSFEATRSYGASDGQ